MATPVLAELAASLADYERRLISSGSLRHRRAPNATAEGVVRGLPRPAELLAIATQRLDIASGRLGAALHRNTAAHAEAMARTAGRLKS